MAEIEVFADVRCPFTHVGLRRLVERRHSLGRDDVALVVRSWPLELVNGEPMDGDMIAEEVQEIRAQVAPDLFGGFDRERFPASSLPALALAARARATAPVSAERVSLMVRDAMFEEGLDIADEAVLTDIASRAGVEAPDTKGLDAVRADWQEGRERGVVGSPTFFVGGERVFCPTLEITKVDGKILIAHDSAAFERFAAACFAR